MERKIRSEVDIKYFNGPVKIEKEFPVGSPGERYVYQVAHQNVNYILKGFKIQLEHLSPEKKKSKELFMKSLVEISEVFQEYYFSKAASQFSPHITAPLCLDFAIEVAKDKASYSYIYIEAIFEYGGVALSSLQPTTLESTYNLMRQSANALFMLHNLGIAHFDIKPANMVYDVKNDLLKIIDMGSAFGSSNRKKLSATTKKLDGKVRTGTPQYAPPEMLRRSEDPNKNPNLGLSLPGIDVYCWGMSFFAMLTNRKNDDLAKDSDSHRSGSKEEYKDFMEIVEHLFNSVETKNSKESGLKNIIENLLAKALKYIPKERPTMRDIIDEMRKFERKKKYDLKYSKEEVKYNESLMKLLVSINDNVSDMVKLSCEHEINKDNLVNHVLESFLRKKNYNYSCLCMVCQKVQKLKSLPLDCGCVWTQFGTKIDLDKNGQGKCSESEVLNSIDLGLVNDFMNFGFVVQMFSDYPEEKKGPNLMNRLNEALAEDAIKVPSKAAKKSKSENKTTRLDFNFEKLEGKDIKAIAEKIKADPTVGALNLSYHKIEDGSAKAITEELKAYRALRILNLNNDGNYGMGVNVAKAIGEVLKSDTELTELNLNHNRIKDEGTRIITDALKNNIVLEKLNISYNAIGAEGAKAIGDMLKKNTPLKELNLYNNKIGDEGAKAISKSLETNTTLVKLDLRYNIIGYEGSQAIDKLLKNKEALTILYIN